MDCYFAVTDAVRHEDGLLPVGRSTQKVSEPSAGEVPRNVER